MHLVEVVQVGCTGEVLACACVWVGSGCELAALSSGGERRRSWA